jgi:hypothetical protein
MVFNAFRQSTPIENSKQAKSKAKPSTQANPAPDQASKPSKHATARNAPSKRQAKQAQHSGKASQKQWAKLRPSV